MRRLFSRKKSKITIDPYKDVPTELVEFYTHTTAEIAEIFNVDIYKGLTDTAVEESRKKWGSNILKQKGGKRLYQIIWGQLSNILFLILLCAFAASLATQQWIDSGVILFVIAVNALIGITQEYKSERTMEALKKMSSPSSRVLRNGDKITIPSDEIVPGDIVLLASGDKVPADLLLTYVSALESDEKLLTGESVPVTKDTEPTPADTPLGDRSNCAFMSAVITKGKARGIAVFTGQRTELGKIAQSISKAEKQVTQLEKRMKWLAIILAITAIISVGLVLLGLWLHDTVPMYPEGLEVALVQQLL
eukprot:TRINITY_DN5172_c0_g1_i1.p1 TRINITY_DN5172_c0_g1~~TRINITY_DN5172_c0_g1_i1.p1  ORF type:complete len:306 (-),score=48.51 TRINITY_DN5172_c0_g1_i1:365-1282(-)